MTLEPIYSLDLPDKTTLIKASTSQRHIIYLGLDILFEVYKRYRGADRFGTITITNADGKLLDYLVVSWDTIPLIIQMHAEQDDISCYIKWCQLRGETNAA